jgi:hypothetical protein
VNVSACLRFSSRNASYKERFSNDREAGFLIVDAKGARPLDENDITGGVCPNVTVRLRMPR